MSETVNTNELKALDEQRADLIQEMKDLTDQVEMEQRAFTDEENANFDSMKAQIEAIDNTVAKLEEARAIDFKKNEEKTVMNDEKLTQEEMDVRAFAAYIRNSNSMQVRADTNLTFTDNGAVIPTSIANKILAKVYDICPLYQMATRYNVKGTLVIPYYDESESEITMAYADEFTELESTSGKYQSIELKGFLAGCLTKVSRSLVNNSDFDIVNDIINRMAISISRWITDQMINGATDKIEGLSGVKLTVEGELNGDTLIAAQDKIPDIYQSGAVWIMNRDTRTKIRQLKDYENHFVLNPDMTATWGYTLLGKPVYCDDNVKDDELYYGDMSGLALKVTEDIDTQILYEKYATQHAIGINSWMEFDCKVEDAQKIVKVTFTEAEDPDTTKLSATAATTSSKKKSE